jgi:isoquinoline 1-oxidoreductase alpha subunit
MELNVNGKTSVVEAAPDTPLLWVLRDELGLTGTKYGCGISQCGACTVHMNGEAIRSCVTPLSEAIGKKIITIEGLGAKGLHPVQKAWIEEDVVQCGYCQPGHIMTAAALLAHNSNPSDADIDQAMGGLICRCGTYERLRKAIHTAAALMRDGSA